MEPNRKISSVRIIFKEILSVAKFTPKYNRQDKYQTQHSNKF